MTLEVFSRWSLGTLVLRYTTTDLASLWEAEASTWELFFFCCFSFNFPGGSDGEESSCSSRDLGSIPGLGRSPGEGSGNPLQYSCLGNTMDRGAWWATVHRVSKESHMTEHTQRDSWFILQCGTNLCCTTNWLTYTHIDILFLTILFHWFITGYRIYFTVVL